MLTHEKLKRIKFLDKEIDAQLRELENLRSIMGSVKGVDYAKDRVQTSQAADVYTLVDKMMDLESGINAKIDRLVELKREVHKEIAELKSPQDRIILQLRYVELKSWNRIAHELNYSLRYIYKLHGQVLKNLDDKEQMGKRRQRL